MCFQLNMVLFLKIFNSKMAWKNELCWVENWKAGFQAIYRGAEGIGTQGVCSNLPTKCLGKTWRQNSIQQNVSIRWLRWVSLSNSRNKNVFILTTDLVVFVEKTSEELFITREMKAHAAPMHGHISLVQPCTVSVHVCKGPI